MAVHTVVETSKLAAVRGGAHIWSLIAEEEIDNGQYGYVDTLDTEVEGQETYTFGTFDASSLNKHRLVLVANPEWSYDECKRINQALSNYTNAAGVPFRGFDLIEGDVFAVSEDGFETSASDSEIKEKYYVIPVADTRKWKVVKTEAEAKDSGFIGIIDGAVKRGGGWTAKNKTVYGRPYTMYWIRVLKNTALPDAE